MYKHCFIRYCNNGTNIMTQVLHLPVEDITNEAANVALSYILKIYRQEPNGAKVVLLEGKEVVREIEFQPP